MKLRDVGEHGFLDRLRHRHRGARPGVLVGIGDDCALVHADDPRFLLTTDTLVENVHFRVGWDTPEGLGRRAFAVNASDVAAMGGMPRFALLALTAPGDTDLDDLDGIVRGFESAAGRCGCALVGGNLARAMELSITVTVAGEPATRPILREGAAAGDGLWVTGALGGAAFARDLLLRGERPSSPEVLRPFLRPIPRLETGAALAKRRLATAAIDVSDGLLQDLGHLCRASGVGAVVDAAKVPLAPALRELSRERALEYALSGGEDYELLFTVRRDRQGRLRGGSRARPVRGIRRIGTITREGGIRVEGARVRAEGFDHFGGR